MHMNTYTNMFKVYGICSYSFHVHVQYMYFYMKRFKHLLIYYPREVDKFGSVRGIRGIPWYSFLENTTVFNANSSGSSEVKKLRRNPVDTLDCMQICIRLVKKTRVFSLLWSLIKQLLVLNDLKVITVCIYSLFAIKSL